MSIVGMLVRDSGARFVQSSQVAISTLLFLIQVDGRLAIACNHIDRNSRRAYSNTSLVRLNIEIPVNGAIVAISLLQPLIGSLEVTTVQESLMC